MMEKKIKSGVPTPDMFSGKKGGRGIWQVWVASMNEGDCVDIPSVSDYLIYVAAYRLCSTLMSRRRADCLVDGFVSILRVFNGLYCSHYLCC